MAQFALENNSNIVETLTLTDNIINCHSILWVVFTHPDEWDWSTDTVLYRGSEWDPMSSKIIEQPGGKKNSLLCFPKGITTTVNKDCPDIGSLASFLGKRVSTDSTAWKFAPSYKNVMMGALLYKYRLQALEDLSVNSDALYLYYNGREFYANTLKSLSTINVVKLSSGQFRDTVINAQYQYINSSKMSDYAAAQPPSVKNYSSYYKNIFREFVQLDTILPLSTGYVYQMNSGNSKIDSLGSMFLIKSVFDSRKNPMPYRHVFGRLNNG